MKHIYLIAILFIPGEYIQLTNQLEDILQDVLRIDCNDLDKPEVSKVKKYIIQRYIVI